HRRLDVVLVDGAVIGPVGLGVVGLQAVVEVDGPLAEARERRHSSSGSSGFVLVRTTALGFASASAGSSGFTSDAASAAGFVVVSVSGSATGSAAGSAAAGPSSTSRGLRTTMR